MKEKESLTAVVSETNPSEASQSSTEDVQRHWQGVVKRRSFLKGLGIAGATLSASAILGTKSNAETARSTGKLSRGDAALLRFAAAVELIEADLWQQYNELGGVQGGNPAYIAALSNLDGDMPQYIADNTDDELSHAAFLNAYLISKGEEPVDLDASQAARVSGSEFQRCRTALTPSSTCSTETRSMTEVRSAREQFNCISTVLPPRLLLMAVRQQLPLRS
jgi:hypothetical protein